nr:hypothetical protein [Tanacetum cinerariifolium]
MAEKRYRGTFELILDTNSKGDELGDEDTEEDGEDESLDTDDKREGEPLGLGYGASRRSELVVGEYQTLPSPEWSYSSLLVSPSSRVVPSPRLEALSPTLFEGYDRDLRELYTRSGADRDEIFSQRLYMIFRGSHDLRTQIAKERYERLELADRVSRMEKRHESREE